MRSSFGERRERERGRERGRLAALGWGRGREEEEEAEAKEDKCSLFPLPSSSRRRPPSAPAARLRQSQTVTRPSSHRPPRESELTQAEKVILGLILFSVSSPLFSSPAVPLEELACGKGPKAESSPSPAAAQVSLNPPSTPTAMLMLCCLWVKGTTPPPRLLLPFCSLLSLSFAVMWLPVASLSSSPFPPRRWHHSFSFPSSSSPPRSSPPPFPHSQAATEIGGKGEKGKGQQISSQKLLKEMERKRPYFPFLSSFRLPFPFPFSFGYFLSFRT